MADLTTFLDIANRLKEVRRAGWVRSGVTDAESVADHTWGVTLMALLLAPPELNRERLLAMATVHDLAEAVVGDITPHDAIAAGEKRNRENAAMEKLADAAGAPELVTLWDEYDQSNTPEARFIHELDALEMATQAISYQWAGHLKPAAVRQFLASASSRIHSPQLRKLFDGLASSDARQ